MLDETLQDAETLVLLFAELASRTLVNECLSQFEDLELTPAQAESLMFLCRHQPSHVGDLAAGLSVSYPAATKAIDRLVAKGLVWRKENARDRRQADLGLTESGQEVIDRLRVGRRERLSGILRRLPAEENKALFRGLRGFIASAITADKALIETSCLHCGSDCYERCIVYQAHLAFHKRAISGV